MVEDLEVNQTSHYVKRLTEAEKKVDEQLKENIAAIYYGRDSYVWSEQIKKRGFLQHCTQAPGLDTVMLKARAVINANILHIK